MTEKGYHLNWDALKSDWPLWVILAGLLLAAVVLYPHLPDQIPSHWNVRGEVDNYASRWSGAFGPPLLALGLYVLMVFLPAIDPRRDNYQRFLGAYRLVRWSLVFFLGGLYALTILYALGYDIDIAIAVKAGVALFLTLIGNFMSRFRHNYFVGIKTPWALASEEVWQKTHRFGGRIWVAGGLMCLALSPFDNLWSAYFYFGTMLVMVAVPTVYSYLIFRQLAG